jgi:hypothetical protein
MYWTYLIQVTENRPFGTFSYEFTLTIRVVGEADESLCPHYHKWLFKGWAFEAALVKPWEERSEIFCYWQPISNVLITIARWPLPTLYVTENASHPMLLAAAVTGIFQGPDGLALREVTVLAPEGAAFLERVKLVSGEGKPSATLAVQFPEGCRVDYEFIGRTGWHSGSAWWSSKAQGWVYAQGEASMGYLLRYRLELINWWGAG